MSGPERIYGWLHGHLSIARYYGGCSFNGQHYSIAYNEAEQPLVRVDVLAREKKAKRAERSAAVQVDLFGVGA